MRGGDLCDRVHKSVVWEDVESAFEGRLKTGIIVNLEYSRLSRECENSISKRNSTRQENAAKVNITLEENTIL